MAYNELELRIKTITELKRIGGVLGVAKYSQKTSSELIHDILSIQGGTLQPAIMRRGRPKKDDLANTENNENNDEIAGKIIEDKNAEIKIMKRGRLNKIIDDKSGIITEEMLKQPMIGGFQEPITYTIAQPIIPSWQKEKMELEAEDLIQPLSEIEQIMPEPNNAIKAKIYGKATSSQKFEITNIDNKNASDNMQSNLIDNKKQPMFQTSKNRLAQNENNNKINSSFQHNSYSNSYQQGLPANQFTMQINNVDEEKNNFENSLSMETGSSNLSLNTNIPYGIDGVKRRCAIVDKSARGVRSADAEIRDGIKSRRSKAPEEDISNDEDSDLYFDSIGVVEIVPETFGYLRTLNYYPSEADLYIPLMQIKRFGLRNGDKLKTRARFFPNNKYASVIYIYEINNIPCDKLTYRPNFDDLVPVYPTERFRLEDGLHRFEIALRVIDLVSPIGRGQRGLIVSPPKAGKTTLLKSIAQALLKTYNDIELIMLLVDERPEEVTDIQESVEGAEIVYSTFDMPPEHHTKVAELVMKRAKRSVELGKHVVILLDSITRLSRAYNQVTEQTGKTLTGGLDSAALFEPKRFFGAARSIKNGGSLTVIATALVDTGSKMDDIIYEEFKGTGNMEIHLSRKMSERRIFPAVDLNKSGTRREELLLTPKELEGMWIVRRALSRADSSDATEQMLEMLMATKSNNEFIDYLKTKKLSLNNINPNRLD
ncbi:MAG: transcription termination factor Rho [Clostridia bacterium]